MATLGVALASKWFVVGDYATLVKEFGKDKVWKYSKLNARVILPAPSGGGRRADGANLKKNIDYLIEMNYEQMCGFLSYGGLRRHRQFQGDYNTLRLMRMRRRAGGVEYDIPKKFREDRGLDKLKSACMIKPRLKRRHKKTKKKK